MQFQLFLYRVFDDRLNHELKLWDWVFLNYYFENWQNLYPIQRKNFVLMQNYFGFAQSFVPIPTSLGYEGPTRLSGPILYFMIQKVIKNLICNVKKVSLLVFESSWARISSNANAIYLECYIYQQSRGWPSGWRAEYKRSSFFPTTAKKN